MIRLEDLPFVSELEGVIISELDRQHLDGAIEVSATGESYFDSIDGDIGGRPDWFAVAKAVLHAVRMEEGQ